MFIDSNNGFGYIYETLQDVIDCVRENPVTDKIGADEPFFHEYDDVTQEYAGSSYSCREIAEIGGFELDIIE